MFPCFPCINISNCASGNAETVGDLMLCPSISSEQSRFADFLVSQYGGGSELTAQHGFGMEAHTVSVASCGAFGSGVASVRSPTRLTSFIALVFYIVFLRTFEQVCAVTAWRPIAGVAGIQRPRIFTRLQIVSNAACAKISILDREFSVTSRMAVANPFPAITVRPLARRFINLGPEAFNVFLGKGREWFRIFCRHGMNLTDRFVSSLGSFGVQPSFEPLVL